MSISTLGRRFDVGLLLRIALLLLAATALVWAAVRPGLYATTLLAGIATAATLFMLWSFIRRTNLTVARFVEAVAHGDLTQGFATGGAGAGFTALGTSLDAAVARLRAERADTQSENRFLAALIEDVPSPLLSVAPDGQVRLLNKSARRLFSLTSGVRIGDLAVYGADFAAAVMSAKAGDRTAVRLDLSGAPTAALLSVAEVQQGRGITRIIGVQPIQAELDRAELTAQTDLVRVLTHEIMNSMTPVTSLSATAATLIAAADKGDDPAITDARAAIETVARRAEGVMHFVRTYRQLTRPPDLRRRHIALAPLFAELRQLIESDWPLLAMNIDTDTVSLGVEADPDLLAQLLINLLRNAAQAASGTHTAPRVTLSAHRLMGGVAIDVVDNGPGIPPEQRQDIFLPFFTTKADGTGVGLSLARQIALAHGASLTCEMTDAGTRFRLLL